MNELVEQRSGPLLSSIDLEMMLESSYDAIFTKSLNNAIILWSNGAENIYGYSRDEMAGQSVSKIFPENRKDEEHWILDEIKAGRSIRMYETVRVTKDGRHINVLLTVLPLLNNRGELTGALSIARDVTDRYIAEQTVRHLEVEIHNHALVLETANRVALDILSHRTGVEALRHIAEAARQLVGAQYGAIGVASISKTGLDEFVTVGMADADEERIGGKPVGAGILGMLLERHEPIRIDVIAEHESSVGFPEGHPQMTTFLGVPIVRGETILGSLYLADKTNGQSFSVADEIAVRALGSYAAVAIHNLHTLAHQKALVRGLIYAQEEERRNVAYDLHDGLTQYIMASHAHLESFRRASQAGNVIKSETEFSQSLCLLNKAVVESRRMINGLRTLALDDLGLAGALEQLLADEKVRSNWSETDLIHNIEGRRFDKTLETAVYRVAQEALTNAHKHAHASRVRLKLLTRPVGQLGIPQLFLEVRDWGIGFKPEEENRGYEHLGLHSMLERVHVMGGSYKLTSVIGEGTMVSAVFPIIEPDVFEKEDDNK